MRCEFCGGKLTLEDEVCPYCGRENEDAKQHIQAMKRYEQEFNSTKQDVYSTAKTYSEVVIRLIIVAVLIILLVGVVALEHNVYSIRRNIMSKWADSHFEQYSRIMDDYLEQQNYLEFNDFCEKKYIRTYDETYAEYQVMIRAAGAYSSVCDSVMDWTGNNSQYMDLDWTIRYFSEELNDFYRRCDLEEYYDIDQIDKEKTEETLTKMKEQVAAMLQIYCHLTEEEADSLETMSDARRTVLLEERLVGDE